MATRIFVAQLRPQNVNRLSLVRFACDNGEAANATPTATATAAGCALTFV